MNNKAELSLILKNLDEAKEELNKLIDFNFTKKSTLEDLNALKQLSQSAVTNSKALIDDLKKWTQSNFKENELYSKVIPDKIDDTKVKNGKKTKSK